METQVNRKKRWLSPTRDPQKEQRLAAELGVSNVVASLLVSRGYEDPQKAYKFLHPSLDDLGAPQLLPDYQAAVATLMAAKESGDLIFVHGDYDVDGVTSAALFDRFLRKTGFNVHTHVPHRMREGYGIHMDAVEAAKQMGAKVLLTCDCGIAAHEQVKAANEAGMKVVVTDHHTVGNELPAAAAVMNPHRKDSQYPFDELSGAGVVFRFCEGLCQELGFPVDKYRRAYLDLAVLGTIADLMPLVDDNRIIAKFGLEALSTTNKVGLQALKQVTNILGIPLSTYHVGFVLGPRLNAAGRIDDSAIALRLLLETNMDTAVQMATMINQVNEERKAEQERIAAEAVELVKTEELLGSKVLVVGHSGWHPGIVGIVASKLVETYLRPAFVLSYDSVNQVYKGSGRSVTGFNLAHVIHTQKELFVSGGGHEMAAGCSFKAENLAAVRAAFDQYAIENFSDEELTPALTTDIEVQPGELTAELLEEVEILQPFGVANPKPTFFTRNLELTAANPTKNPAHVRLSVRGETHRSQLVMGFGFGDQFADINNGSRLDIAFNAGFNEFQGRREIQWQLKDFKLL